MNRKRNVQEMFDGFTLHTNRKDIIFFYAVSAIVFIFGLFVVFRQLGDADSRNITKAAQGALISLCGLAFGLIVYYRDKIPNRVKFYTICLAFVIACAFMIVHPEGTGRYNHPTINRIVGITGTAFFGGGLLFVAYKDIRWHIEHRKDVDKSMGSTTCRAIIQTGDNERVILDATDYDSFCLRINSMVYRKKSSPDYSVRGWLDIPNITVGKQTVRGPLMFFVQSDDKSFDNVCFMTSEGHCFLQEFSGTQQIREVPTKGMTFEMPS